MAKTDVIRKWQQMPPNVIASESGVVTSTVGVGNADTVDGFHASATAIGNTILALNGDAKLPTSITGDANTVDGYDAAELAGIAEAETVTGLWTFSRGASAPFAVASGAAKVAYLDADKLDGYEASAFPRKAEAAIITGGWTFQADIQADCDLDFVGAQAITTTANNLTLAPAGDLVLDPGGDDVLPAVNYDINLGSITKKYLALHAAELWVQTLVAQDVVATIGGRVIVGPTTTLTEDFAASPTNLLSNPSFETAGSGTTFDDWTEFLTDGVVTDETVIVSSGSHACKIAYGSDANDRIASAQIAVTPGNAYRLTFQTRGDGTNAGRYAVWNATAGSSIIVTRSTNKTAAVYAWVTDYFVAPAGCTAVQVIFYPPAVAGGYCYFDNVSVRDSTITVEHNEMSPDTTGGAGSAGWTGDGDNIYMEADGKLEWMYVLSGPTGAGPYTYGVVRDRDGTGRNDWYAGDAIVNTGAEGDGIIDLYSVDGITGGGAGPTIVGWVRQSDTYNDIEERWAIGNLNGLYGISDNYYGVGIGDPDGDHLLYDTNGGFRIVAAGGNLSLDENGMIFSAYEGSLGSDSSILWNDGDGDPVGELASMFSEGLGASLGDNHVYLMARSKAARESRLYLEAYSPYYADEPNRALVVLNAVYNSTDECSMYIEASSYGTVIDTYADDFNVHGDFHVQSGTTDKVILYSADGDVRLAGGLWVGSAGFDPAVGDVIANNDGRFAGGLYVGATSTAPTDGCVHIPVGNLVGTTYNSFSDDSAMSFTPANAYGAVLVMGRAGTYDHLSALVVYRTGATPATYLLAGGSSVAVTTGELTGTTGDPGSDTKFTISAHTDGKIYFQNRLGMAVSIHYICFGA